MPSRRMKAFFQNTLFFIISSNFPNFNFFLISSQKNLKNKVERHFKEILPFEKHSRKSSPFAISSDFRKFQVFFRKKRLFFQKKPHILNVLTNILSFPVAFYGKFVRVWWKKFDVQNEPTSFLSELNWQTAGKKRTYLRGRFCFHVLKIMAQFNN